MPNKEFFWNPPSRYRVNPMTHRWGANPAAKMQALRDYGYGGVVTNVAFENGFTSNEENLKQFGEILAGLKESGLSYWIYDEAGYPSGRGYDLTLKDHPELSAKGFYMHRRIAYEPVHARYRLDDESIRILWAAKYPANIGRGGRSAVDFSKMSPVPFTDTDAECDLAAGEVFYVFCEKNTHEGTHSAHNANSVMRNINILDKRAVRRFLDLCYEPIVKAIPDAYAKACNVFTDEPSLHVAYVCESETWPYALAPWVDGLFEEYEKEYGESLLPKLPLLFEGDAQAYPVRVKFYRLIGKLVAEAYTGQLREWCEAHGCGFSGHYLCEERMTHHVLQYGDFVRVLRASSYPGIDILACYPEMYEHGSVKFAQIAVRKEHTNGMMVEICPFLNVDEFARDALNNMTCVMGMLYLGGVRVTNSYFSADFTGWHNNRLLDSGGGYTNEAETRWFNEYVGRLGAMLDGLDNRCGTFLYYTLEEVQAKNRPLHCSGWDGGVRLADHSTFALMNEVYESGHDFYFADGEDLDEALHTLSENGIPTISGNPVRVILVPTVDVLYQSSADALKKLMKAGVTVRVIDRLPVYAAETGEKLECDLPTATLNEILPLLPADAEFPERAQGGTVLRGKFEKDHQTIWMLVNKSRTDASLTYAGPDGELWNPIDGTVSPLSSGETIVIPAMRALFTVSNSDNEI